MRCRSLRSEAGVQELHVLYMNVQELEVKDLEVKEPEVQNKKGLGAGGQGE